MGKATRESLEGVKAHFHIFFDTRLGKDLATEPTINLHCLLAILGRSRSFLAWYDVACKIPYCQEPGAESS
jgi:hypothetical protein